MQSDMQRGVHGRLMDNSTSVREAAVELLGRFVLSRPQLTEQYYDMLIERILVCTSTLNIYTNLAVVEVKGHSFNKQSDMYLNYIISYIIIIIIHFNVTTLKFLTVLKKKNPIFSESQSLTLQINFEHKNIREVKLS